MEKVLILCSLLTFALPACPNNGPAPVNNDTNYCKAAQLHLEDLGCIQKDKPYTAKGKSFTQFCEDTMKNGIDLSPKCISEVSSCSQVNSCIQKKK